MRSLTAAELLTVWELGLNQSILQRALLLVAAASPELEYSEVEKLSIGARDARLLQLREWIFGAQLLNTAHCPKCGEQVEWESRTDQLRLQNIDEIPAEQEYSHNANGFRLRFRLPTSMDIAAIIARAPNDKKNGRTALLERCVIAATCSGKIYQTNQLPETTIELLGQHISELDPQAEIRTSLTCPVCPHQWEVLFDIASFLWAEINSWAERTLQTIDRLARAYGWTEQEILNLSPIRRQLYLGMVS